MQDAELFFQAADHRHLFLYIDGLAETEARRQADVCNYVRKRLDDYEALQKEVKRLEQELQQEKDANALLQKQLAQQSREAAVHSSRKTTTEDKQAGPAPALDSAEYWYKIGEQYACGIGVPRDDAGARQWYTKAAATFKKAAEQGDAAAQNRLGTMYKEGKGVPQNNDRARCWFEKAAEQEHADAQFCLGDMYKEGKGVPQNNDRACQWYAKAAAQGHKASLSVLKQLAEQGHADAQLSLGDMYANGIGVPRDEDRALQWYAKAARQSHKVNLSVLKQLAEQGHADAQFRLGDRYKEGKGVPRDGDMACQWYAKAVATLKKAAEQGDADAQYRLGTMYKEGKGVPRNDDMACQWYAKAAAQGHEAGLCVLKQLAVQGDADVQFCLGDMYKKGKGVPRDGDMARRWLKKAAEQGHADAQYRLGDMYNKGEGMPRDNARAQQWYAKAAATLKKAAEQGNADAQYRLGDMYKKGEGVPQDDDRACQWYAEAAAQGHKAGLNALKQLAEQGNADAQFRLDNMYKKAKASRGTATSLARGMQKPPRRGRKKA